MPYRPSYYIGKMDALRAARGGRCEWDPPCSVTENLEFAHTKPTGQWGRGRGRAERYHDIKRHPDAYILLCRQHHKEQEWRVSQRDATGRFVPVVEREPGDDTGQEDAAD